MITNQLHYQLCYFGMVGLVVIHLYGYPESPHIIQVRPDFVDTVGLEPNPPHCKCGALSNYATCPSMISHINSIKKNEHRLLFLTRLLAISSVAPPAIDPAFI